MTELDTKVATTRPSSRRYYDEDDDENVLPSNKMDLYKKYAFEEAVKACEMIEGASLITIHNQDEQNFLTHLLFESFSTGDVWIGLKQVSGSEKGKKLGWVDGSPFNFTDWFPGEPRFLNKDKLCVTLFSEMEFQGKWFERDCNDKKYAVCQKPRRSNNDEQKITREMHLDTSPLLLSICIVLALILSFTCYVAEFSKAQRLLNQNVSVWFSRPRMTRENSVESGPKFDNRF